MMRTSIAALVAAFPLIAAAGVPCEPQSMTARDALHPVAMAEQTLEVLDALPDQVVLIARAGQNLDKYGLTYSHMAFAVRSSEQGWRVLHELNGCGSSTSGIYEEGLVNFFTDNPYRYQAGIWRLTPALQSKLHGLLVSDKFKQFHEPSYNMLAYPFSTKYQNSNGWILETLAASSVGADILPTRAGVQTYLSTHGYQPTQLELGPTTRLGARTRANIAFDDHPGELRWSGRIRTVTVDSIVAWLGASKMCLQDGCPEKRVDLVKP